MKEEEEGKGPRRFLVLNSEHGLAVAGHGMHHFVKGCMPNLEVEKTSPALRTKHDAIAELERCVRAAPGKTFYVVELVLSASSSPGPLVVDRRFW